MTTTVSILHYFPVKGLSAQTLESATLTPGEGLPQDRRFAITHGATTFDVLAPAWRPKNNFLALMRDERLATLDARYDAANCTLVLMRAGKAVARGRIDTPTGRLLIEQFLAAYMKGAAVPPPYKVIEATGHMFSDIAEKAVSLINLASVKDLERVVQAPVDPRRFRGNLLLSGLAPWAERQWVGKRLRVGDVVLEVFKDIRRCAATEVNPVTGERDMAVVKSLMNGYGHVDCGVYARVIEGGTVNPGDTVDVIGGYRSAANFLGATAW
ncbi:MOSC domain-containing protein [Azospirillum sp. B4]|uniref:MOSC domain-containing protein n=1 Tax=Azospirillum sp. B4 TaxID=95605 RepID=UPI000348E9F7|nr:MOSC domain-containing protein [Azospirillum sp. B4]